MDKAVAVSNPGQDSFFRNNIIRELLAINRREAEIRQVGRDTRLVDETESYSEIYGGCGYFHR